MRTTAQSVRPTDVVRGIGLVVEYVEPETDYVTRLVGRVGRGDEAFETSVLVPNDHIVRVRRLFEAGDAVTVPAHLAANIVDTDYPYVPCNVLAVDPVARALVAEVETHGHVLDVPFELARHATA